MKVGIYLSDQAPEIGGGYTFQWDIFYSLLNLAGESKHNFILFCNPKCVNEIRKSLRYNNNMQVIPFQKPGFVERSISALKREVPIFRIRWKWQSRLECKARKAGVEFMWFISAGSYFMDIPYLTVVWDMTHRLQPWFPEVSAKGAWDSREAAYSWFLQRASVIIAGTNAGKLQIEKFYQIPSERIKILPHPTPKFALNKPASKNKSVLTKYRIPESYLFYPAQFWPHKNHVNLLLAVRILRDHHSLTFPIVFTGSDKGNKNYVRMLVNKLNLSQQVKFLGFVPQDDLVGLYQNALALTYLSFCGPENLPPLEAFAVRCPVVASDIPGAQEQLGDAALLVNPGNPVEIALGIKSIYHDSELRNSLIEKGFQRASNWTGEDFVRSVFRILDEFESIRHCWDL